MYVFNMQVQASTSVLPEPESPNEPVSGVRREVSQHKKVQTETSRASRQADGSRSRPAKRLASRSPQRDQPAQKVRRIRLVYMYIWFLKVDTCFNV